MEEKSDLINLEVAIHMNKEDEGFMRLKGGKFLFLIPSHIIWSDWKCRIWIVRMLTSRIRKVIERNRRFFERDVLAMKASWFEQHYMLMELLNLGLLALLCSLQTIKIFSIQSCFLTWTLLPTEVMYFSATAKIHNSHSTKQWLATRNVTIMYCPSSSPDLNPI